jgi:hypothetical protein
MPVAAWRVVGGSATFELVAPTDEVHGSTLHGPTLMVQHFMVQHFMVHHFMGHHFLGQRFMGAGRLTETASSPARENSAISGSLSTFALAQTPRPMARA